MREFHIRSQDRDDVAGDAIAIVLGKRPTPCVGATLAGYVAGVVRNLVHDRRRTEVRMRLALAACEAALAEAERSAIRGATSRNACEEPDEEALAPSRGGTPTAAQRRALDLLRSGLSLVEVAAEFGISTASVRERVERGLIRESGGRGPSEAARGWTSAVLARGGLSALDRHVCTRWGERASYREIAEETRATWKSARERVRRLRRSAAS